MEALRSALNEKEFEITTVKSAIAERDKELKAASDRRAKTDNLTKETQQIEADTNELHEYCKKARTEIDDFPTDTQLLKLERRLESLKNQVKESERSVLQRATGVQAYNDRVVGCSSQRQHIFDTSRTAVSFEVGNASSQSKFEEDRATLKAVLDAIDALTSIAEEREGQLQELQQKISSRMQEESTRSARIRELQQHSQTEIPKLKAERERTVAEITAEWNREYDHLRSTYNRLFSVNKEQQYHLARGTHIKVVSEKSAVLEEQALSAQQARLAADINETGSRLQELKDELRYIRRQCETLRSTGREAQAEFERQMAEWRDRDEEAEKERDGALQEAQSLREVKLELASVLNTIRET